MKFECANSESLIQYLRRALPFSAYPRPALVAFLHARGFAGRGSPRLIVLDVFDAGAARGIMCRFAIAEDANAANFIAPLAQVALARRRPARLRVARQRPPPPRIGVA